MQGVQFGSYGDPEKVLECVELPEPAAPGAGQALLQVEFAPVNANDLMIPRGIYASRPPVPALMGNEGVAHVVAVGPGVTNVGNGDRVALPLGSKTWRDRLLLDAAGLFALPRGAEAKQLAMLTVNPPTAALLLSEFAMSENPMVVNPLDAIFKSLTLRGFWMGHPEYASKLGPAMREAAQMIEAGEVAIGVASVYPIRQVKKAAAHAAKGAKVLLEIAP